MSVKTHVIVWFVTTILLLLINVFVTNSSTVAEYHKERDWTRSMMGEVGYKRLRDKSLVIYDMCCVTLAKITDEAYVKPTIDNNTLHGYAEAIHIGFWTTLYLAIHRFLLVMDWYYYYSFLIAGFFVQGLVKRRIRKTIVAWSSPLIFDVGFHINVAIAGTFFMYLFWPWAIFPYISSMWIVFMALSLYLITSNVQHRI